MRAERKKNCRVAINKNVRNEKAVNVHGILEISKKRRWPRQVTNKDASIRGLVRIRFD